MVSKGIPPMHGKALQAFRNNDFSPESAIAEVIDNSIQAESNNIKIRIEFGKPHSIRKPRPVTIAFGDDGIGMDPKILQKCLVLGESTRENDRTGIGRFGVGMTNGAISVCNKIEVYSRPHQGHWNFVELDLNKLDDEGAPYITIVKESPLPKKYKDLVGDKGTLVIWSDIDRIESNFNSTDLKHWISRTFRKFIGEKIIEDEKIIDNKNKVTLTVDIIGESKETDGSETLEAFDPLYLIPNKHRPNDKTAEMIDDWEIKFDVSDIDKPDNDVKQGKIIIRMSLTPEEWRKGQGAGGSAENRDRYIDKNEGISVLRNHREVAYGHIPQWNPKFDDLDRWWSCEIDFDAVLDHQFSVKNIKVGARPLIQLREQLQNEINGTRDDQLKKIRAVYAKNKSNQITGGDTSGNHEESEEGEKDIIQSDPPKPLSPEEKKKQEEALKRKQINEQETEEILKKIDDPNAPPILLMNSLKDQSTGNYIEIERLGNKTVVWLNMNHQFFQQVYDKLKIINELSENSKDPEKTKLVNIASDLKRDIDNLIISYTDTQNKLLKTENNISDPLERLLMNWSLCLRKLYKNSSEG